MSARLAEAGVQAPAALARGGDLAAQWRDPGLIFGQTCGYPYVTGLEKRRHADRGAGICLPRLRRRRASKLHHPPRRATRAASSRNFAARRPRSTAQDSNTGMNLFRAAIAPIAGRAPFFRAIVVTGSHEASLTAVAEGQADLASIDCVSFALIERGRPELVERVAVVAESPLSPGLPFIVSARPRGADDRRGSRGAARRRSPTRTWPRRARRSVSRARARRARPSMIVWPRSSATPRRRDTPVSRRASDVALTSPAMPPRSPACDPLSRPCGSAR